MTINKITVIVKSPIPWLLILIISVAAAFGYLAQETPSINDSIGYEHAGKQLSLGHGPTYAPPNSALEGPYFSLFAFQINRENDSRMYLGYPPGLSLLLAAAILTAGSVTVMPYVVPVIAVIGIILAYAFGKVLGEHPWIGFWTTAILATLPAYWYYSTATWSEVPSMTFILMGALFYFGAHQSEAGTYRKGTYSLLGGLFISFSFFIRYTNVLFLPAFLLYDIITYRKDALKNKEQWPFYLVTGLGVVSILIFNYFYYGGFFTTSYSPVYGWYPYPAFSLKYAFGPSFVSGYSFIEAVKTLWANFSLLLLLVPFGWIYLKKKGVFLAAATLLPIGVYSIYAFAPSGLNGRFLIPTFPFISVAIAAALWRLGKKVDSQPLRWVLALILFAFLLRGKPEQVRSLNTRNLNAENTAEMVKEMVSFSDENAVFLSYRFNDQISVFGNRSVLNFRRIPPSDPDEQKYHIEMLEPCLTYMIEELQLDNIPLYYVSLDNFWDVKTLIENHFHLELVEGKSSIYQIKLPPDYEFGQGKCPDQTR